MTRKSVLDGTVSKEADVSRTHFPVHNDDKRDVHGEKCMLRWGGSSRKSERFKMYGGREWWVGGKNGQWLNAVAGPQHVHPHMSERVFKGTIQ